MKELEQRKKNHARFDGSVPFRQLGQGYLVVESAHWCLNNSLGGSTGFDASARSGRRAERNDPKLAPNVGGESSEIAWYALKQSRPTFFT